MRQSNVRELFYDDSVHVLQNNNTKAQFRAPDPTQLNSTQLAVELS